jgi:hypothetical protein
MFVGSVLGNHNQSLLQSVVDPDPVGPGTFIRIQIRKKNHSGSEQLRIRNEFEEKSENW